jgi:hypothetical protein
LTRDCSTPKRDKITFADQEPHRIELRFLIYGGSWRERLLWLDAYDFNYPLIAVAAPPGKPVLPPQLGLMSADGGAELVDALPLGDSTYVFVFSNPSRGPSKRSPPSTCPTLGSRWWTGGSWGRRSSARCAGPRKSR